MQKLESVQLIVGNVGRSKIPFDSQQNENIWAGECSSCMSKLYCDEAFRKSWVDKKASIPPADEQASKSEGSKQRWDVLKRPPLLKSVVWDFWGVDPDLDNHEAF